MTSRKSFLQVCVAWFAGAILLAGLSGCDGSREPKSETRKQRSSILDKIQLGGVVKASIGHGAEKASTGYRPEKASANGAKKGSGGFPDRGLVRKNVPADFNPDIESPRVHASAWVDPLSSVIGNVEIGRRVYLAPFSSVRGDEGQPIHIGNESNLQDGVVIHALETVAYGKPVWKNTYAVNDRRYAVYIGDRVSLAHQSHVHGPAYIEDDVFVGMQAMVFMSHVGRGSVIEPGAKVMGVSIPPGRCVKIGSIVADQKTADNLPEITESYQFRNINKAVVHVNTSLADGYSGRGSKKGHAAKPGPAAKKSH